MGYVVNTKELTDARHKCDLPQFLTPDGEHEDLDLLRAHSWSIWRCDVCGKYWELRLVHPFDPPRWDRITWWDFKANRIVRNDRRARAARGEVEPSPPLVITGPRKVGPPK